MQGRPYILCGRPCFVLFPRPRCGMLTARKRGGDRHGGLLGPCGVGERCGGLSAAAVGGAARGADGAAAAAPRRGGLRRGLRRAPARSAVLAVAERRGIRRDGAACLPRHGAGAQAGTADAVALLRSRRGRDAARTMCRLARARRARRDLCTASVGRAARRDGRDLSTALDRFSRRSAARRRGAAARKAHARREDRHAPAAARQRQSAHRSPHRGERSGHRAERPARAAAGARGGLHNAFLHDSGRQHGAAGVLLRQRSRERQGLGTAAGRRFAGHLRRQRLSGRMAHGGTGGGT